MPFTDGYQFPSDSELNVEEVNISTPALRAGAYYFGKHCEEPSKEFMLCRTEERDPRKCLAEGREVTKCALDFFRKTKKACRQQFDDYAHCLEWSSSDMEYRHCRKTQAALDGCMLDKLGIERPHLGYFTMPRIHHTERPRPTEKEYRDDYPKTPKLEDDFPRTPARHGVRSLV